MAVKLVEKIDFGITTADKTSRYPITVKLQMTAEDEATFEAFRVRAEEEYEAVNTATLRRVQIDKEVVRYREDEEDLNLELESAEQGSESKGKLIMVRKVTRTKRRALEDEASTLEQTYTPDTLAKASKKLSEEIARTSFLLHVVEDDKREALMDAIATAGISYTVVTAELSRLIVEAKAKK